MSFFNKIKEKLTPEPSGMPMSASASGGIGNSRGALGFEDDVSNICSLVRVVVSRRKRVALVLATLNPFYVTMFILVHELYFRGIDRVHHIYSYFLGLMALGFYFYCRLFMFLTHSSSYPADDRFETRYYMPLLSSLLRLPCYVLLCWRGQLSGAL